MARTKRTRARLLNPPSSGGYLEGLPAQFPLPLSGDPALPEHRAQLLSVARERLPALRVELEFWTLVLARLGETPVPPPALPRPAKPTAR